MGLINFSHLPFSSSTRAAQFPGLVTSPFGQMELEGTLPSGWGCGSVTCLDMGKTGSRASKIPPLTLWIRQADLHPIKFLGQDAPTTWFCRWTKSLFGIISNWALQVWTWSVKIQVLVVEPCLLSSITVSLSGWAHRFPYNPCCVRSEQVLSPWLTVHGGASCPPWAFFSPERSQKLRADLCTCCRADLDVVGNTVNVSSLLLPLECCLSWSLWCKVVQPHSNVLGFSQLCLVHE